MVFILAEPIEDVFVYAENKGIVIKSNSLDITDPNKLRLKVAKSRLGRLLPGLLCQLLEMGIGQLENNQFCIPYDDFIELNSYQIDAFEDICPWSPFTIELSTKGSLGYADFRYTYKFFYGYQQVTLERVGCFIKRVNKIYRFDKQTFSLLEEIEKFNNLPDEVKLSKDAYINFSQVKGLAENISAKIDKYILSQRILVPSKVAIDILDHGNGRISLVPKFDEVSDESVRAAFLQNNDIDQIFSLDPINNENIFVVLDESQQEVLRRIRKFRRISGVEKAQVLSNPNVIFDGVAEAVDVKDFAPRVKGIGDFPFVAQPYIQHSNVGIFDDVNGYSQNQKFSAGIKCQYLDGNEEYVEFSSRAEVLDFNQKVEESWRKGLGTVQFKDKNIVIDKHFVDSFRGLLSKVTPLQPTSNPTRISESERKYLLIYTNESDLEYTEQTEDVNLSQTLDLPKSLKPNTYLKDHQKQGISWLQTNYSFSRKGCLLADDMGLGKTLQILTFLAWIIERGDISFEPSKKEQAPWKPILVITPIILLDSQTWINDMKKFFQAEGAVFEPYVVLRGNELKSFRQAKSQETKIGQAVLDINKLLNYRIVFTNYETIVNYQHSFAKMSDNWSVIVTDEAQEYKTPNTKISHALKSLFPKFRIACTGTPVETRLLDLWNLFDFLQPGHLGSAKTFSKEYEQPSNEQVNVNDKNIPAGINRLRDRLFFGKPNSFVLRREKNHLLDLPKKHEHKLMCYLSEEQRNWHLDIIQKSKSRLQENHPFKLIQCLLKLYQHPALVPQYAPTTTEEAVSQCPKIQTLIEILKDVKRKREKALIFTRSLDMQQMLSTIFKDVFGLSVDIVNGSISRKGTTQSSNKTRSGIIQTFKEKEGFNILILSPDVAGMGLTLVEANHVVHYGRWWNPAKEAQATDRVYRIGQNKEVHVYYLLAIDPYNQFKTFDQKLDDIIQKRRVLANDFLSPMPPEEQLEEELMKSVFQTDLTTSSQVNQIAKEEVGRLSWDRFEALVAVLETKKGAKVLLTPKTCDEGIDVISFVNKEIRLIQCKHTYVDTQIDEEVIYELVTAVDSYRIRLNKLTKNYSLKPVVVTNGKITKQAVKEAEVRNIELISDRNFIETLEHSVCSFAEVESMGFSRFSSMKDVQLAIDNIY